MHDIEKTLLAHYIYYLGAKQLEICPLAPCSVCRRQMGIHQSSCCFAAGHNVESYLPGFEKHPPSYSTQTLWWLLYKFILLSDAEQKEWQNKWHRKLDGTVWGHHSAQQLWNLFLGRSL